MKTIFLPAMLVLTATAAHAQSEQAAPAAADEAAKKKRVCIEQPKTGSLFKQRVCKTQEQWDEEAEKTKQAMNSWSRQSGSRYSGGGDAGGGVRSGMGIGGN